MPDMAGKAVRSMKRYEVLMERKLFPGSDIVRSFGYKVAALRDNYALLGKRIVLCAAHHLTG